jgi:hypothetical protein
MNTAPRRHQDGVDLDRGDAERGAPFDGEDFEARSLARVIRP